MRVREKQKHTLKIMLLDIYGMILETVDFITGNKQLLLCITEEISHLFRLLPVPSLIRAYDQCNDALKTGTQQSH